MGLLLRDSLYEETTNFYRCLQTIRHMEAELAGLRRRPAELDMVTPLLYTAEKYFARTDCATSTCVKENAMKFSLLYLFYSVKLLTVK